jgi:sulfite reductase alpha subunit-like flavoprotein
MLFNKKGHIYICGDVRMAADVTNEIELGLKQKYKISIEEAKDYINEMRVKICLLVCCQNLP